ncbi:tyrosine-protein phosphatase non-receptor type 14 [Macrosteles quadrilineatus]|uniref:tyrosine-protein phosphatase non-receptor type 14 n=1 Tax=Macrosteles quadrilineatus TaxID=74068 RepID=UPI0023E09B1A|nr:tyrosine-protein phosphatase non-receptor type 14 [Macrosteles quadrilineatus]
MPFKLRLKKSRQYNVVSKSLFVICVELLDSTTIECTLSAESVGRECLDNVCQRLGLQQPEFFGLRYISRSGSPRWVELERPLKRQLDKHARDFNLYLRVMFYVTGINLLHDEMTRYHYFLQLKNDVIEGRMSCDPKQAVLLASYCMQAEFGNYDVERHTAEYLKDFALFPKHLTQQGHLESLTEAVILQYSALAGLAQGTAEEYYILAAQQLDGYGQETFLAKDESGNEVVIGVSLTGIVVASEHSHTSKFYRWKDITNVINHKRHFGMECQSPEDTTQFQLADVESAKYVWRMCVHQHTFFMQNEQASESNNAAQTGLFTQTSTEDAQLGSSREELDGRDVGGGVGWEREVQRAQSTSCLDLAASQDIDKLRAMLPSYRPAPDYETAVQQKYRGQGALLYSSQPEIHQGHLHEGVRSYGNAYKHYPDVARVDRVYIDPAHSEDAVSGLHTYGRAQLTDQGLQLVHLYKPPPPYPINRHSSNSTPDLASQNLGQPMHAFISTQQVSGSSPDLVCSRVVGQHPPPHPHHYEAHRTYPNLAAILTNDQQQHIEELHNVYDDRNIMYYMSRGGALMTQQQQVAQQHVMAFNNNQQYSTSTSQGVGTEPIYENVPLPWQQEGGEPRSRTSSIQSAPEMTRAVSASVPTTAPPTTATLPPKAPVNDSIDSSGSLRSSDSSKQGKQRPKWGGLLGRGKSKHAGSTSSHGDLGPRLPLPPTISKETMCQLLERKLVDNQLFFEFEKIPKQKVNPDFSTALHPDNASRNRFKDVLPYEENRVRLSPSKENKTGYINASHITATVGSHQRFYIAAQSPLPSTLACFWQMVWEADVYLVVALLDDPSSQVPYWPPSTEHHLEFGELEVYRQLSQETGHCVTSKLRLYHSPSHRSRGIWLLQYSEWGDHGCPTAVSHFLGFLEELSSVRQHIVTEIPAGHNHNPPVLVHCSTGIGPSAVTVLSDLLLYSLDHNQEVDIPRVVSLLRQQRTMMVQSVAQYRFVHSLLIFYLKNSRLI